MSDRHLLALVLGLIFVVPLTADRASAFCRMTTDGEAQVGDQPCVEEGAFLEWPVACIPYAIDARGSSSMDFADVETAIDSAFRTWQEVTCEGQLVDVVFKPRLSSTCQRAEFRNPGGNVNTIAFLDPWEDQCGRAFSRNAFAVTIVWHDPENGDIFDADMMINEALGPYADCDPVEGCPLGTPSNPGPVDLQSIVTHEVGHFIGIGHSDIAGATMFPSSARTEVSKRDLAPDDIEAVCTIYPPGDLQDTCVPEVFNGLDLDCEDDGAPKCDGGVPLPSRGGCTAGAIHSGESPGSVIALALLALMVLRRRSSRRDARS